MFDGTSPLPKQFALSQNYPNPFNPSTRIDFDIPKSGFVSLKIYSILGQEVATLVNGERLAGHYAIQFNAAHLASGMYIYRLQSSSNAIAKKLILLK